MSAQSKAVTNARFTVNSIVSAGPDRVQVSLIEIQVAGATQVQTGYNNNLSLNMATADADLQGFFPGKVFTLNLTPEV